MAARKSREIWLARRPEGMPSRNDFRLGRDRGPRPGSGQVLVRNIYMWVDPYMRGRMGQVVESNNPQVRPGDYVSNFSGWREWFVSSGRRG